MSGIERVEVSAYTIPTDFPESDGTLEWDKTTIIVVESTAGGVTGIGYTYGATAVAELIESKLAGNVKGADRGIRLRRAVFSPDARSGLGGRHSVRRYAVWRYHRVS